MSTENQLWDFLLPRMLPYGRMIRIENAGAGPGTPDIYYNLRGHSGWIEGKHLDDLPNRAKTVIVIPTLTIEQVNWLTDEHNAGGRAFLLLRVTHRLILFTPMQATLIFHRQMTLNDALHFAPYVSNVHGFKPAELYKCLSKSIAI